MRTSRWTFVSSSSFRPNHNDTLSLTNILALFSAFVHLASEACIAHYVAISSCLQSHKTRTFRAQCSHNINPTLSLLTFLSLVTTPRDCKNITSYIQISLSYLSLLICPTKLKIQTRVFRIYPILAPSCVHCTTEYFYSPFILSTGIGIHYTNTVGKKQT